MPEWTLAIWPFAFGACVGSFLNVVVHRWPRRRSLIAPSQCGCCGARIRFYHNVPLLGWCVLRGRCRDCRAWIPVRYPAAELVTALLFTVVASHAWYNGSLSAGPGILLAAYGLGLVLACFVLVVAGMAWDAQRRLAAALLMALLAGLMAILWTVF